MIPSFHPSLPLWISLKWIINLSPCQTCLVSNVWFNRCCITRRTLCNFVFSFLLLIHNHCCSFLVCLKKKRIKWPTWVSSARNVYKSIACMKHASLSALYGGGSGFRMSAYIDKLLYMAFKVRKKGGVQVTRWSMMTKNRLALRDFLGSNSFF